MNDSDRNILASLAGEADEPCTHCGTPVRPMPCNPPGSFRWEYTDDLDRPYCDECDPLPRGRITHPCDECDDTSTHYHDGFSRHE